MPHTCDYISSKDIVQVIGFGDTNLNDLMETLEQIKALSAHHRVQRIYVDIRELKSFPEIVEVAKFTDKLPRNLYYAIIPSSQSKRGINNMALFSKTYPSLLKMFHDETTAMQWLYEQAPRIDSLD